MSQVFYIVLGWSLGLFSPLIVDALKAQFRRAEFVAALRVELEDLQHRLLISSLKILQNRGELDRDFAEGALRLLKD